MTILSCVGFFLLVLGTSLYARSLTPEIPRIIPIGPVLYKMKAFLILGGISMILYAIIRINPDFLYYLARSSF